MDTKKYYKLYWREFVGSAKKAIGWKELLYLCISLVVGATIYLFRNGINAMNDQIISFIAFSLAPAILLAFLFVIYHLIQTHPKLYREKQIQANRPTFRDIEIKKHLFDPRENFKVGLEIINKKISAPGVNYDDVRISGVEPRLERVDGEGAPGDVQGVLPILFDNFLFWNGGQFLLNTPSVLLIAKSDQNTAWIEYKKTFTFEEDIKTIEIKKNTRYKLLIMIAGNVGIRGWPMEKCRVTLDLFYSDEKGIEVSNFKREPDYDPY